VGGWLFLEALQIEKSMVATAETCTPKSEPLCSDLASHPWNPSNGILVQDAPPFTPRSPQPQSI